MNTRQFLAAALAAGALGAAHAQTNWDLPTAYPASYLHTEYIQQFSNAVV